MLTPNYFLGGGGGGGGGLLFGGEGLMLVCCPPLLPAGGRVFEAYVGGGELEARFPIIVPFASLRPI